MQELFGMFPGLLEQFKENDRVTEAFVFAAWRKTAGGPLRERTQPLGYAKTRLTLAVENAIWKRHLEDLSGDILFRLNGVLGQGVVTFIEFRVDKAAVDASAGRVKGNKEVNFAISPSLTKAAESISDDRLRATFLEAAGVYLSRSEPKA